MKSAGATLRGILYNNEQHRCFDLWTFAFADGTRYWSGGDASVNDGSHLFVPGPGFQRGEITSRTGLETDTLDVRLWPDATTIGGLPMFQAAIQGLFDSVQVTLQRAYVVSSMAEAVAAGTVTEWVGIVDTVEPGPTELRLRVQSLLTKLTLPLPKRLTMAQCPYQLGDAATCKVNLASWTHSRNVAAGSTASAIVLSSSSTNAVIGSWITLTSGALAGMKRMVRTVSGSTLTLAVALPSAPAIGDALTVVHGCKKDQATCSGTFGNLINHGGFPYAPAPKQA